MGVKIAKRLELPATPEQIAALLTDLPRWPEWFALHKGWVGTVPTEAHRGTQFAHKVRVLGVPGDIKWTVSALEYPTHFAIEGKSLSRTSAAIDFRTTPGPQGSTVEFVAELKGLALKPVEGMLKPWLEVRAERTVESMKTLLSEPE